MNSVIRVLTGVLAGGVVPALAAQPFLVRNINAGEDRAGGFRVGSAITGMAPVGDRFFFPASVPDGLLGRRGGFQ